MTIIEFKLGKGYSPDFSKISVEVLQLVRISNPIKLEDGQWVIRIEANAVDNTPAAGVPDEPRNVEGMTRAEFETRIRQEHAYDNVIAKERGITSMTQEKIDADVRERVELNYPSDAFDYAAKNCTGCTAFDNDAMEVHFVQGCAGCVARMQKVAGFGPLLAAPASAQPSVASDEYNPNDWYRVTAVIGDQIEQLNVLDMKPRDNWGVDLAVELPKQPPVAVTEEQKQVINFAADMIDEKFGSPMKASEMLRALLVTSPPKTLTDVARDVIAERQRQVSTEGWSASHDDKHTSHELARAAACYAYQTPRLMLDGKRLWPWDDSWWKDSGYRSCLIKSGALILAEIERLDRRALLSTGETQSTKDQS